jgi:hypothetical protein
VGKESGLTDKGAKNVSIRRDIALRTDREPDPEKYKPEGQRVTHDSRDSVSRDAHGPDFGSGLGNPNGYRVTHDNPRKDDTYKEHEGRVTEGYADSGINDETNSHIGLTRNGITHGNRVTHCLHLLDSVCLSGKGVRMSFRFLEESPSGPGESRGGAS